MTAASETEAEVGMRVDMIEYYSLFSLMLKDNQYFTYWFNEVLTVVYEISAVRVSMTSSGR